MQGAKNAVIVGATSNIGAPVARLLRQQGYHLALLGRDNAAKLANELGGKDANVSAVEFDVDKPTESLASVFKHGSVDVIVYSVGSAAQVLAEFGKDDVLGEEGMRKAYECHLRLAKEGLRQVVEAFAGRLANRATISVVGSAIKDSKKPRGFEQGPYAKAKAAQHEYVLGELTRHPAVIRANGVVHLYRPSILKTSENRLVAQRVSNDPAVGRMWRWLMSEKMYESAALDPAKVAETIVSDIGAAKPVMKFLPWYARWM